MKTFQTLRFTQPATMCAFVERKFSSRHELLHTMAYVIGASVQIIDLNRSTTGYQVSFVVEVDKFEADTADFGLMWPGIDTSAMELAFAEAAVDEARRAYWFDSKAQRKEVFDSYREFYPAKVNFLKWICKAGGSSATYLDGVNNVCWTL